MHRLLAYLGVLALLLGSLCVAPSPAFAQATVVTSCSGNTIPAGTGRPLIMDVNGNLCTSASLSGGSQVPAASTDISGTVTAGGTYQTVLASNVSRKGCLLQNPTTATEVLNVKVGTMANPYTIAAGSTFSCNNGPLVVTDTITATAVTTGHVFVGTSQ